MFGSDEPNLKVKSVVKSIPIQTQLDALIQRNLDTTQQAEDAIDRALASIKQQSPEVTRQIRSGIQTLGDIFSQRYPSTLAAQREAIYQARLGTQEQQLAQARARDKAYAASLGLPGRSSYRDLMEARVMGEIGSQAELERAQMTRSDYMQVLADRMGLQGRIPEGLSQLAAVEAMPATVTSELRGIPLENLRVMTQLDQLNKFYTLYRERDFTEKLADFDDEFWNTIGQLTSMYANVAGAGGGGGATRTPPASSGGSYTVGQGYGGSVEPTQSFYPGSTNPYNRWGNEQVGGAPGVGLQQSAPREIGANESLYPGSTNPYAQRTNAPVEFSQMGSLPTY